MKEVKVKGKNENFYLTIYNYIKDNGKLPNTSLSKQALNWYVSRLKKEDLIYKVAYGVWAVKKEVKEVKVTPKDTPHPLYKGGSPKKFTNSALSRQDIRGHAFILKFKIPAVKNWENREKYLKGKNIDYISLGFRGLTQQITFKGFKVWLASKSIIIYCPKDVSYFNSSAQNSRNTAVKSLLGIFQGLEKLLNVGLRFTDGYHFTVSRQHYAKVNDFFAKYMNERDNKIRVSNSNGEWFVIDNSFNLNEAETVHSKTAVKDMDNIIKPFLNDLKDHYDTTGEVIQLSEMFKSIFKIQQQTMIIQERNEEMIKRIIQRLEL